MKYFVVRVCEERKPVFCLVEDLREEDKVGTVLSSGIYLDAS
jgi:hypothetical protein